MIQCPLQLCVKLTAEEGGTSFQNALKVVTTLRKNLFYKPPPQDVVKVTPVVMLWPLIISTVELKTRNVN